MSTHRQIKFKALFEQERDAGNILRWEYIGVNESLDPLMQNYLNQKSPWLEFTGLTDCKGVEVYEGDVVQVKVGGKNHAKLIIKYLGRSFVMGHPDDDNEMDCVWYYDFKVIGNIYETKTPTP